MYYLLKYDFLASVGGCEEELQIVDANSDRNVLLTYLKDKFYDDVYIDTINDIPRGEFELCEEEDSWKVKYRVDGSVIENSCLYQIVKQQEKGKFKEVIYYCSLLINSIQINPKPFQENPKEAFSMLSNRHNKLSIKIKGG